MTMIKLILGLLLMSVSFHANAASLDFTRDKGYDVGFAESFVQSHGFIGVEYGLPGPDRRLQGGNGDSTFDVHEVYLTITANVRENIKARLDFEYEHQTRTLLLPMQAYADIAMHPLATLRIGQFYSPFGLPRSETLRAPTLKGVRQYGGTHDIVYENWSQTGLNLYGVTKPQPIQAFYDVALTNGVDGIDTGDTNWTMSGSGGRDNNANKMTIARTGVILWDALRLAGSYAAGSYSSLDENRDIKLVGADLRLIWKDFELLSEYIRRTGDDDPTLQVTKPYIGGSAYSWMVQPYYTLLKGKKLIHSLGFGVRVDELDLRRHYDSTQDVRTISPVVIWHPYDHLQFKCEYNFVQEINLPAGTSSLNNDILWLAAVVDF
jgi:hypothetical protein